MECAGLCLANEQCYVFQWEESDLKCSLMKEDSICYSDDPTQSTSVYVDQFDPFPVYMECNQHQSGNFENITVFTCFRSFLLTVKSN